MGCDFGDFLVVDRQGRKVQSGFPSIESAQRYISRRGKTHGIWSVARFTKSGITQLSPVRRVRPRVKHRQVVALWEEGLSGPKIAKRLGYAGPSSVFRVLRELRRSGHRIAKRYGQGASV